MTLGRVRFLIFCLTAWTLALIAQPAQAANGTVSAEYTVKLASFSPPIFHVTCDVKGIKEDRIDLSLPTYVPGLPTIENFARNIQRFKVTDASGNRVRSYLVQKQTWRAETKGIDRIKAEFDYIASTLGSDRAKISPDFAFFSGFNLFLMVEGHRDSAATVRLDIPPDWKVASSLTETKDPTTFTARDYDTLVESPTLMGKPDAFRVNKFEVLGKPHYLVITPATAANEEKAGKFVDMIKKVVSTEGQIFGGLPYDKYTFFYFFMVADQNPVLEFLDSHVVFIEANETPTSHTLLNTVGHAFFHTWNFRRFRPVEEWARDYSREPSSSLYWVVEGFSNYYANQTKIRSGLANQAKFIDNVRDAIIAVEMNEVRAYTPPADASMSAWYRFQSPGGAFPISVHQQGNMLANLIDLSIRQDTQGAASLDDVVRSLYQDFYLKGKGYSTEDLIGVINRITKKDYKDFFAKYVQGVEVPPYDTILGYAGYKLEKVAVPAPIMGFRMATSNDGPVVSFITPGSPAEEGGVQLGDVIITIDEMDVRKAGHALPGLKDWLTPKIGQAVDVVIKRNGVDKTLKVKVGSRDEFTLKVNEVSQPTPEQLKIRAGWMGGSATGGVAAAK